MGRVIVVGSINQDIVVSLDSAPKAGETIFADSLNLFPGGKGANQAVAASRAGADVLFYGKIGDDVFGRAQQDFLKEQGIALNLSVENDVETGAAIIFVEASGENRIALVPGANMKVSDQDLFTAKELGKDDIVVVQNEIPALTVESALKLAKEAGASTIFNVAPASTISSSAISNTDFLVVNEVEFELVLGERLDIENRSNTCDVVADAAKSFRRGVILTLGSKGIIAAIDGTVIDIPSYRLKAIDTTGAGDCFVGNLAASIARQVPINDALNTANKAAALSVLTLGASASFPTESEVSQWDIKLAS